MKTPEPDTGGSRMTYAELLERYRDKHGPLVRPESLDSSLHLAFSMGLARSFTNAGTYNPASRLPSGAKSDHAVYPAMAFDLRRKGWTGLFGYGYWAARRLADLYVANAYALHIEYLIVGRRIWSRSKGWHAYDDDRSHDLHIHVSGLR